MNPIKEREAKRVYDIFWDSYQKGDLQTFASTLDEDFEMIGTSESEIAHSKADGIRFFKSQMDEVVGIAEMRNRQITVLPRDHYILINEVCDIYVLSGSDWNFYSKIRISTWLKESENGWKVAQQHGSFPDMRVKEGETLAIDKINKENLELRDAIKRRTIELENKSKELEIEASLERVRTVAMGMKSPDDMLQVCRIIASQLKILGVKHIRNVQTAIIESNEEIYLCYQFFPSYDRDIIERTEYPKNPVEKEMVEQMLAAKDNHFMGVLKNEELKDFREHRKIENYLTDPLLDEVNELGYCFLSIGEGGLGLTLYQSLDEQSLALFKRFHQVFSLAYQRFRDIQKAEAQTREAEIQLALERVRAKTMAMNTQSDLLGVIKLFGEQLNAVKIKFDNLTFIEGAITKERDWDLWSYVSLEGGLALKIHIPYFQSPYFLKTAKAVEKYEKTGQPIHVKTFTDKEKNEFLDHYWKHVPEMPKELVNSVYSSPGSTIVDAFMGEITVSLVRWDLEDYREDELKIFERFAKEFRQTYIRFLDIKKAEAQAREARIEAGLERVRSKSLAMYQTNELQSVIHSVHEELLKLDLSIFGGSFIVVNSELDNELRCWGSGGTADTSDEVYIPRFDKPFYTNLLEGIKKGPGFFTEKYSATEKAEFFTFLFTREPWSNLSAEDKKQTLETKGGYTRSCVVSEHTSIFIINHEGIPFSDADNAILKRFGKVFEQSYTRFLDLQKAEAQAREAQIEAALERVRSKSIGMQKSDELYDVILEVHKKFRELDISMESRIAIVAVLNSDSKDFNQYIASQDVGNIYISTPYFEHPILDDFYEAKEARVEFFSKSYTEEEKNSYFKRFFETSFTSAEIAGLEEQAKWVFAQKFYTHSQAFQKNSCIGMADYSGVPLNDSEIDIIIRFSKVFDQAYTRFLDLQKAEIQARESKIEAALERVRAAGMAMHQSEDLAEASTVLFEQLMELGVEARRVGFALPNDEKQEFTVWSTIRDDDGKARLLSAFLHYDQHPIYPKMIENWHEGQKTFGFELHGSDLQDYYKAWNKTFKTPGSLEKTIKENESEYYQFASFEQGLIYAFTAAPLSGEEHQLLSRFAKAFELTYTRFLDLQKAEGQAREARIEAALEKVRSRTMAMQHSDELAETAAVLFHQLISLGVKHERINIGIVSEKEKLVEFWSTEQSGNIILNSFTGSINEPTVLHKLYQGWKQKRESLVIHLEGDELKQWITYCKNEIGIPFDERQLGEQRFQTAAFFSKGMLMLTTHDQPPAESSELLIRFASVFNLTFTRFSDLKVAEANAVKAAQDLVEIKNAREKAEQALSDLKSAQEQLVQQEKLASLGQLTAGIAHEIKNPLNFVNNFSDLSRELIEEVFEVFDQMEDSKTKEEVLEILQDVRNNLNKIHEHGSRADSIVTSMLQHSRASGNKQELKEFNPIVKEFVNLSFHGMRAGKNPINVEIIQELDPMIKEVNLIQEDFSRVILNLCNNAFDAMRDKLLKTEDGRREPEDGNRYLPKLTVKTALHKDKVILSIADNGGGIPKEIQNKVFQPFFTTKKGTEGTGLGLSITHDIIKAHGGELKLETSLGEGSIFSISIPIR